MFVRICLCDIILYTWFGKQWRRLKKVWGWKICLVYTYFFKHLSSSMLISFMLIKEKSVIILATMLLKLFCSNLLHSWKLKATRMAPSQYQCFQVYFGFMFLLTLTPQWTYFLLVWKIILFSNEKVVVTQFGAGRWFYAICAKWLPLKKQVIFFTSIDNVGRQNTETEKQRETIGGKKKKRIIIPTMNR